MLVMAIVILVAAICNFLLGFFVYRSNPRIYLNRWYGIFSFVASLWTLSNFMTGVLNTPFWIKNVYAFGVLVPATAVMWILELCRRRLKRNEIIILWLLAAIVFFIPYIDGLLLVNITNVYLGGLDAEYGPLFPLYATYMAGLLIFVVFRLNWSYKKTKEKVEQRQLKFVAIGATMWVSIVLLVSFVLPFFGIFNFTSLDSPTSFIFLVFATYAIVKHHLFNPRVIATELFAIAICVVLLIKFLLSNGFYNYLINGSILASTVLFGLLLVRSVIHEVEQKKKIEAMAEDVKRAYELEKQAREELQRIGEAKSQFIMATQHHLRTPLTALKGYLSMVLDGDFGKINKTVKEKLGFCFESTNRLIKLVNEFLDISKLQLGRDILDIKEASITELLRDVIVEVKPEADKKNIYLTLTLPEGNIPLAMADSVKLREALYNLIDNAVKYTEKGGVKVNLRADSKKGKNVLFITVTDTGIGMTEEETKEVFGRQFERGKEAKKVYALGRGIGLYIAASIIKAHKGKIWAESPGQGKGSAFHVELVAK